MPEDDMERSVTEEAVAAVEVRMKELVAEALKETEEKNAKRLNAAMKASQNNLDDAVGAIMEKMNQILTDGKKPQETPRKEPEYQAVTRDMTRDELDELSYLRGKVGMDGARLGTLTVTEKARYDQLTGQYHVNTLREKNDALLVKAETSEAKMKQLEKSLSETKKLLLEITSSKQPPTGIRRQAHRSGIEDDEDEDDQGNETNNGLTGHGGVNGYRKALRHALTMDQGLVPWPYRGYTQTQLDALVTKQTSEFTQAFKVSGLLNLNYSTTKKKMSMKEILTKLSELTMEYNLSPTLFFRILFQIIEGEVRSSAKLQLDMGASHEEVFTLLQVQAKDELTISEASSKLAQLRDDPSNHTITDMFRKVLKLCDRSNVHQDVFTKPTIVASMAHATMTTILETHVHAVFHTAIFKDERNIKSADIGVTPLARYNQLEQICKNNLTISYRFQKGGGDGSQYGFAPVRQMSQRQPSDVGRHSQGQHARPSNYRVSEVLCQQEEEVMVDNITEENFEDYYNNSQPTEAVIAEIRGGPGGFNKGGRDQTNRGYDRFRKVMQRYPYGNCMKCNSSGHRNKECPLYKMAVDLDEYCGTCRCNHSEKECKTSRQNYLPDESHPSHPPQLRVCTISLVDDGSRFNDNYVDVHGIEVNDTIPMTQDSGETDDYDNDDNLLDLGSLIVEPETSPVEKPVEQAMDLVTSREPSTVLSQDLQPSQSPTHDLLNTQHKAEITQKLKTQKENSGPNLSILGVACRRVVKALRTDLTEEVWMPCTNAVRHGTNFLGGELFEGALDAINPGYDNANAHLCTTIGYGFLKIFLLLYLIILQLFGFIAWPAASFLDSLLGGMKHTVNGARKIRKAWKGRRRVPIYDLDKKNTYRVLPESLKVSAVSSQEIISRVLPRIPMSQTADFTMNRRFGASRSKGMVLSNKGLTRTKETKIDLIGDRTFIKLHLFDHNDTTPFLLDGGAQVSVINERTLEQLEMSVGRLPVFNSHASIEGYAERPLESRGVVRIPTRVSKSQCTPDVIPFFITPEGENVLGINYVRSKRISVQCDDPEIIIQLDTRSKNSFEEIRETPVTLTESVDILPGEYKVCTVTANHIYETGRGFPNNEAIYTSDDEVPASPEALTTVIHNKTKVLLHNKGEHPLHYPAGSPAGTLKPIIETIEVQSAANDLDIIHQHRIIKYNFMKQCFCRVKARNNFNIFLVDNQGRTDFRNVDLRNIFHHPAVLSISPVMTRGKDVFITKDLRSINASHIKQLFEAQMGTDSTVLLHLPDDTHITKDVLKLLALFTHHTQAVEARFYRENDGALCGAHMPFKFLHGSDTTKVCGHILNGGLEPKVPVNQIFESTVRETRVEFFSNTIDGQHIIDFYVHVPEPRLRSSDFLRVTLEDILHYIHSALPARSGKIPLRLTTSRNQAYNSAYSITQSLHSLKTFGFAWGEGIGVDMAKMDDKLYTKPFKLRADCACATCSKIGKEEAGNYSIKAKEKFMVETLDIDCYGGSHYTSEDFEQAILTVSDIEMKISAHNVLYDSEKEKAKESSTDTLEEQLDMEKVPVSEKPFILRMLDIFSHLFIKHDGLSLFRDVRINLTLEDKENSPPERQRPYMSDSKSQELVEKLLLNLVNRGVAKYVEPCEYFSPVFLICRNQQEIEKFIESKGTYTPKVRLVADFRSLNKRNIASHSYIPPMKNLLREVAHKKFCGKLDLSKGFASMPLADESISKTTIYTGNCYVSFLVVIEGLKKAPSAYHFHVSNALVFSKPRQDKLELDAKMYAKEQKDGVTRKVYDLDTLENYVKNRKNDFSSPENLKDEYMDIKDTPERLLDTEAHKLRHKINKDRDQKAIIHRRDIDPKMLSTEVSALSYLDDVAFFSNTREGFRTAILCILCDLSNLGAVVKISKCDFFSIFDDEGAFEFLGHEISPGGFYLPSSSRGARLTTLQAPTNLQTLQSVAGLFNFSSSHIEDFSMKIRPLYNAFPRAKKLGKMFTLSEEERTAFLTLKNDIIHLEKLYLPEEGKMLYLQTDSSRCVGAGMIYAIDPITRERRICSYYGKIYPRYIATKSINLVSEMLALSLACQAFRYFIFSNPTCYIGDCMSLLSIFIYERHSLNSRIERLADSISRFPLKYFIHVESKECIPDVLTRMLLPIKDNRKFTPTIPYKDVKKEDIKGKFEDGIVFKPRELIDLADKKPDEFMPSVLKVESMTAHHEGEIDRIMDTEFKLLPDHLKEIQCARHIPCIHEIFDKPIVSLESLNISVRDPSLRERLFEKKKMSELKESSILQLIDTIFIREHQAKCTEMRLTFDALEVGKTTTHGDYELLSNGVLIKNTTTGPKIVCSTVMIINIITVVHLSFHQSAKMLEAMIKRFFHHPKIAKYCALVAKNCSSCSLMVPNRSYDKIEHGMLQRGASINSVIYIDHIVFAKPIWCNHRQYVGVLQIVCSHSMFLHSRLVTTLASGEIIRVLTGIHMTFGLKNTKIISDNAPCFAGRNIYDWAKRTGVQWHFVTPYNHMGNIAESVNSSFRSMLKAIYANGITNLEHAFELAVSCYNNSPHSWMKHIDVQEDEDKTIIPKADQFITPFQVVHGYGGLPWETILQQEIDDVKVRNKIRTKYQEWALDYFETQRKLAKLINRKQQIEVGSFCIKKDHDKDFKDDPNYGNTLFVIKERFHNNVKMQDFFNPLAPIVKAHVRDLKLYHLRTNSILDHLDPSLLHRLGGRMDQMEAKGKVPSVFVLPRKVVKARTETLADFESDYESVGGNYPPPPSSDDDVEQETPKKLTLTKTKTALTMPSSSNKGSNEKVTNVEKAVTILSRPKERESEEPKNDILNRPDEVIKPFPRNFMTSTPTTPVQPRIQNWLGEKMSVVYTKVKNKWRMPRSTKGTADVNTPQATGIRESEESPITHPQQVHHSSMEKTRNEPDQPRGAQSLPKAFAESIRIPMKRGTRPKSRKEIRTEENEDTPRRPRQSKTRFDYKAFGRGYGKLRK